jgi:hypothetical protein
VRTGENLFDRGANSLSLMSVFAKVQEILEVDIPPELVLNSMFDNPTVSAQATTIHDWLSSASAQGT